MPQNSNPHDNHGGIRRATKEGILNGELCRIERVFLAVSVTDTLSYGRLGKYNNRQTFLTSLPQSLSFRSTYYIPSPYVLRVIGFTLC